MRRLPTDIWNSISRGIRLLAFLRLTPVSHPPGSAALLILIILNFGLLAASGAIDAWEDLRFSEWGLIVYLATFTLAVAILIFPGRPWPVRHVRQIAADLLAVDAILGVIALLVVGAAAVFRDKIDFLDARVAFAWATVGYGVQAWGLMGIVRAGRSLWPHAPRPAGYRAGLAYVLPILLIPSQPVIYGTYSDWSTNDVWHWSREAFAALSSKDESAPGDYAYETPAYDVEDTFYRQSTLLTGTLGSIMPSEGDDPQFYFLAAAPSSAQDVFAKEVRSAQKIFDDRFGTRGHSVVLINSHDTLDMVPLATNRNIEEVLKKMSKLMNRERDVLVLYITSHGAKDLVSVDLRGFPLKQITPETLAVALDAAHIKNRVLIISACHSGSFIPRLAGPDTLIMTAASADRTSFGCANGRDWTYFGDALFNHAFREELDFEKAFVKAEALIKSWEFWHVFMKASQPQISAGDDIKAVIARAVAARQKRLARLSISP